MLLVQNLACAQGDRVLCKNINFELQASSSMRIHGSNGCGKSSLLKTIAGIMKPHFGKVLLTTHVLYAGHANNLHHALNPIQNLLFITKLQQSVTKIQVIQSLNAVGLNEQLNSTCETLSAGQAQRILLARLLLSIQKIWLLDEPHINLDLQAQQQLHEICERHIQNGGVILIAAHRELNFCKTTLELENYV